jgi:ABC-2 type transport system permease protein
VRDVERVIPIVLRMLFYFSPILYSVNIARKRVGETLAFNPVSGIMMVFRATFFPRELHWSYVAISLVWCVGLLVLGMYTFARLERAVLKEI